MSILIRNCHIISPGVDIERASIEIDGNIVKRIYPEGSPLLDAVEVYNAENHMAVPGFIDVHTHGALAGGTTPYWQMFKNLYKLTKLPLKELIKMTGYNQARGLGLENNGKIEPGFHADITVLDTNFKPRAVFVDGERKL